jgi:hypothetical protein
MSSAIPSIDSLVDVLVDAFVPMTADEQHLIVTGYRLLREGAPVEVAAIAAAAGWSPEAVEVTLRSWLGGAYLDADGRLVGLWGLAVDDVSPHRASLAGGPWVWMWCALDPLFIAPAMGASRVDLRSVCPTTGESIALRVDAGDVTVEPETAVVSFLLPDGPFTDDVRQSFCHFVHLFVSRAAADTWIAAHPGTFWLPVADAAEVGRRLAAQSFAAVTDR